MLAVPRFYRVDDELQIRCPVCGNENLHRHTVTVFDRGEDAPYLTETRISENGDVRVRRLKSHNPSRRRDGVTISFTCEICDGREKPVGELCIYQHKGTEYIVWRSPSSVDDYEFDTLMMPRPAA